MSNLAKYNRSAQDKTFPDTEETVFGHMIVELGMTPAQAVQEVRPWIKDLTKASNSAKDLCGYLAIAGVGVGVVVGSLTTFGLSAIAPIVGGAICFTLSRQSAAEVHPREAEYMMLKECPELLYIIHALNKRGLGAAVIVEAYDDLVAKFQAVHFQGSDVGMRGEIATKEEIVQTFQELIDQKALIAGVASQIMDGFKVEDFDELYDREPSAPMMGRGATVQRSIEPAFAEERQPRRITTQLGEPSAVNVPSLPVAAEEFQTKRTEERKRRNGVELFDFNMLREKPDEFTAFAIVADMGGGKTRLIKHLARNILQGSTMTVMDIYARRGDWTGSKILTNVFDFVEYMEKDLVDIDDLIGDYRDGRTAFTPDLFVLEEAADTLTEAKEQSAKKLKLWLSKYLTVTRKIRKRLCMVSTNIADITSAIESAEKRNSVVFIFPGKNGVAKAMSDSYIFKLGTAENAQLRERLSRAMEGLERPALVHLRGQWWVADIPFVNEDGSLPGQESAQPAPVAQESESDDPWEAEEATPAQSIEDYVTAVANYVDDSGMISGAKICESFDMTAIEAMQLMQMTAYASRGKLKYDHKQQVLRKSNVR